MLEKNTNYTYHDDYLNVRWISLKRNVSRRIIKYVMYLVIFFLINNGSTFIIYRYDVDVLYCSWKEDQLLLFNVRILPLNRIIT